MFAAVPPPVPHVAGSVGKLFVQRLAVVDAAAHELRPLRHRNARGERFRQQTPKRRLVPAEVVPCRIPMLADAGSQSSHFRQELVPRELLEIEQPKPNS